MSFDFRFDEDYSFLNLVKEVKYQIQRREEMECQTRDAFGRWEIRNSDEEFREKVAGPFIDESLDVWREKLHKQYPNRLWEPLWPEGKSFAVCLTHDADHVNSFSIRERARRFINQVHNKKPSISTLSLFSRDVIKASTKNLMRLKDPLWGYSRWLKLEDSFGFKSTINFFAERINKWHPIDCSYAFNDKVVFNNQQMSVGEMIREIDKAGWDIGIHGSYYSALEPGLLKRQKNQVERLLDKEIGSTRQHYLNYDVMKTPRIHADAGIKVDSTHGFNRSIGFRAGTSYPYLCWDPSREETLGVLEIPLHIQDGALFSLNSMGLNSVDSAVKVSLQLMDRIEAVSGCLSLLWHPSSFSDEVRWKTYEILLEEAKRRNAWGCSMSELSSWWTARTEKIMSVRN